MKTSTKVTSIVIIFFLIITAVVVGRTMIGNHFKKKFGKRPPPGIIITEVAKKEFSEKIETFGTAISNKSETFKIKKEMKNELLDLYKKLNPYPEVQECLENLKTKKIKIAILSNGTPDLLKELVESNNIQNYFDDILSVESVGIYKPDSKVYEMPINKYNCKPENICFMSSNTWDVSGGGIYGYNTVWVCRNKNIFDKLDYIPKNKVANLKQLLDII